MPVIALPRINAYLDGQCLDCVVGDIPRALTMYVALTLVCLSDKEIRDMSTDVVFIADCVASKNLLKSETVSVNKTKLVD